MQSRTSYNIILFLKQLWKAPLFHPPYIARGYSLQYILHLIFVYYKQYVKTDHVTKEFHCPD